MNFKKTMSIGSATKNVQDIYLNCAFALSTVKKWFVDFEIVISIKTIKFALVYLITSIMT